MEVEVLQRHDAPNIETVPFRTDRPAALRVRS